MFSGLLGTAFSVLLRVDSYPKNSRLIVLESSLDIAGLLHHICMEVPYYLDMMRGYSQDTFIQIGNHFNRLHVDRARAWFDVYYDMIAP